MSQGEQDIGPGTGERLRPRLDRGASPDESRLAAVLGAGAPGLRQLIDRLRVGVLLQGARSEVLFVNPAALEMMGLTEAQILGKTSFDARAIREDGSPLPGGEHPGPRALATGRPVRDVVVGFQRGGEPAWFLVDAEPLTAPDGS